MQLVSIEINDPNVGWKLERAEFFSDVTLLVGLSGVGKTRILESIRKLSSISRGITSARFFGIDWRLEFNHGGSSFVWTGQYEAAGDDNDEIFSTLEPPFIEDDNANTPSLLLEQLQIDGVVIADRKGETILLDGKETPKLSNKESLIHILKNEESVGKAHSGLDSILHVDHSESRRQFYSFRSKFEMLKKKLATIEQIRAEDIPTHLKLALVHENCPDIFDDISTQFQEAFPNVDEIGIRYVEFGPSNKLPRLYMKESGVDKLIPEEAFSSGMHRTLLHLSRMSLWPDGTVVLVDEFENSFGVNCIHYVTQDLQVHSQRMQFILTSHHPYIINNIEKKNWKIVSRKGNAVKVSGSELLKTESSHHEAFLQLLNLPQYFEGIYVE